MANSIYEYFNHILCEWHTHFNFTVVLNEELTGLANLVSPLC